MLSRLKAFPWPGNIRELNSLIESYLILLGNRRHDEGLFAELFEEYEGAYRPGPKPSRKDENALASSAAEAPGDGPGSPTLADHLERHKVAIIRQTLRQCGNSRKLAARKLGISTNTLWRALKKRRDNGDDGRMPPDRSPITEA